MSHLLKILICSIKNNVILLDFYTISKYIMRYVFWLVNLNSQEIKKLKNVISTKNCKINCQHGINNYDAENFLFNEFQFSNEKIKQNWNN